MLPSIVTVEVRKTVSDREYGNEQVSVKITAELEEGETPESVALKLRRIAREQVMDELGLSESIHIRRAINPPARICNECGEPLADSERSYLHGPCAEIARNNRDAERERERLDREAAGEQDESADLSRMPF